MMVMVMGIYYEVFMNILKEQKQSQWIPDYGMTVKDVVSALARVRDTDVIVCYDDGLPVSLEIFVENDNSAVMVEDDPALDFSGHTVSDFMLDFKRETEACRSARFVRIHSDKSRSIISRVAVDRDVSDDLWGGVPRVVLFCEEFY